MTYKHIFILIISFSVLCFKTQENEIEFCGEYNYKDRYKQVRLLINFDGSYEEETFHKVSPCWTNSRTAGFWSITSDTIILKSKDGEKIRSLTLRKNRLKDHTPIFDGAQFIYTGITFKKKNACR